MKANGKEIRGQAAQKRVAALQSKKLATLLAAAAPAETPPVPLDAGLTYVTDSLPGLTRRPFRTGFRFLDTQGKPVRDAAIRDRILRLAIPPAWTDVWICPQSNGHLQATGRDARGRKQYIYHPDFRASREDSKFQHLLAFATALPAIRRRVRRDMARRRLDRPKVAATILFLLETTLIRIGNSEYARTNRSFGITTLRNPHVKVEGSAIKFKFPGKSGRIWNVQLSSRRAAKIIRSCQELPGQLLFQYENAEGGLSPVSSTDINFYLREISGKDITAKDYRTWAGTVLASKMLHELDADVANRKKALRAVINHVADQLGNTPTICRKCYIHPALQQLFLEGTFVLRPRPARGKSILDPYERAVLALLKKIEKAPTDIISR